MIAAGAYDGRFKNKTFLDKKKEAKRNGCKEKIYDYI